MAVGSNGSNENFLVRSATLPGKAPLSIRCYVRRLVDRNSYSGFAALNKSGDELFYCGTDSDGTTLSAYAGADFIPSEQAIDTSWRQVHYTYGDTCRIYLDRALVFETALSQSGDAAISLTFLNTDFGSWWDGEIYAPAVWERELSSGEVSSDVYATPQATSGLWAWWLLESRTDLNDRSGNGRHLTEAGTLVNAASPSIPLAPASARGAAMSAYLRRRAGR